MQLFDTSVWIDHFRTGCRSLEIALANDTALIHPRIIGELAVGSITKRELVLKDLRALPLAPEVALDEILIFVKNFRLYSRGLSLVDVELMASALVCEAELVTFDRRLLACWNAISRG